MTRFQVNRLARKICLGFIQQGRTPNFNRVKKAIHYPLVKFAKSNLNEGKTKSEMASEMAKDILLAMSDKLNYAENYAYQFQQLFNMIYRDLSIDDKKVAKEKVQ